MPGVISIERVEDHEDGSATYTFELDGEAAKLTQKVGLQFMLYCGVSGVDIQDALHMILKMGEND